MTDNTIERPTTCLRPGYAGPDHDPCRSCPAQGNCPGFPDEAPDDVDADSRDPLSGPRSSACDICAAHDLVTPGAPQRGPAVSEICGTLPRYARPYRICEACWDDGLDERGRQATLLGVPPEHAERCECGEWYDSRDDEGCCPTCAAPAPAGEADDEPMTRCMGCGEEVASDEAIYPSGGGVYCAECDAAPAEAE